MATRPMKSVSGLPGLEDNTYTFLQDDTTLAVQGKAADAKAVGDALAQVDEALESKAEIDGYYDEMAVGSAEQLISTVAAVDTEPYTFRVTGGGNVSAGTRKRESIVGGSIVWNQLNDNDGNPGTTGGVTRTYNEDGTWTFSGTPESDATGSKLRQQVNSDSAFTIPTDHVVYLSAGAELAADCYLLVASGGTLVQSITSGTGGLLKTGSSKKQFWLRWTKEHDFGNGYTITPQLFDLTQMFGADVADALLAMETATAGAGVAVFRKMFPKAMYAYNAGELMSVQAAGMQSVGFNGYNPATGKAMVLGGQAYQIVGTYTGLTLDGATVTPDEDGYFTPVATGELTVTGGDAETCVHLVRDGERDDEFEPYNPHTYALDSTLTLRGIPMWDSTTGRMHYDGDTYAPDGTVTRRYACTRLDQSSITWYTQSHGGKTTIACKLTHLDTAATRDLWFVSGFDCVKNATSATTLDHEKMALNVAGGYYNIRLYINDEVDTTAKFTAWLASEAEAGRYYWFVRLITTPTTETATPYTALQVIDPYGTEAFVDAGTRDVAVPVGHWTEYQQDLRGKLEYLPAKAQADGQYVIAQADGQMSLTAAPTGLPAAPSADGAYTLKATVADGAVTYTWEASE